MQQPALTTCQTACQSPSGYQWWYILSLIASEINNSEKMIYCAVMFQVNAWYIFLNWLFNRSSQAIACTLFWVAACQCEQQIAQLIAQNKMTINILIWLLCFYLCANFLVCRLARCCLLQLYLLQRTICKKYTTRIK